MQIKELLIFNGLELLQILSYAVLNVVFYLKRTWKEVFHKENKGKSKPAELQKLYWATKLAIYNIQKSF